MTLAAGIAFCRRYLGFPYSIAPSRFGLSRPIHFDCSGYAWRYCDEAGTPLPPNVSTTFAMVAYAEDNPRLGLTVVRDFALTHEGVLCLSGGRVPSGKNGSGGHMGVSDGQGGTYEARGTRYGVVRGVIGRRFDFFMVPPGYMTAKPVDPAAIARAQSRAQGDPAMPKRISYRNTSHVFNANGSGQLVHTFFNKPTGSWSALEDVNALAGQPSYRLDLDAPIDAVTRILGGENDLDVYWRGSLGELGHSWYTGEVWGAELLD